MPASGIGFVPSLQEQKFLLSRERPVSTRRPTGKGSVSLPAGLGGTRTGGCGPAVVAVVFGADSEDVGPSLPASATMAALTTPAALMTAAII